MMSRFKKRSPVPLKADIVVEGDGFRSEEAAQVPADVTFRCHINVFAPLMCGRILASKAIAAGHLAVEGDAKLAERFSGWFKGI